MIDQGILLITSAAYVGVELAAEFGKLPPAFLPVGHARLYEWQIRSMAHLLGKRVLTLPESFPIPVWDQSRLSELSVKIIRVPDGLTLGEAILFSLLMIGPIDGVVRLLHGDTLIYDLPAGEDDIAVVGITSSAYSWGSIDHNTKQAQATREILGMEAEVLAGYFCFSNDTELCRALSKGRGDFLVSLENYRSAVALQTSLIEGWLDFGHLQTYYRSRCSIRTQRHFNDLAITFHVVQKTSSNKIKLDAEASWFEELPHPLRAFTATYLGRRQINGSTGYALEYLPVPSLHELFVFGALSEGSWLAIIGSCFDFLHSCSELKPACCEDSAGLLTTEKTRNRLEEFARLGHISVDREWRFRGKLTPSLSRIAETISHAISSTSIETAGVMHGDFCFTNIFFDPRIQRIRTIDPRGSITPEHFTAFGDVRYDLAKFNHSVTGLYDFILANRYTCSGLDTGDVNLDFPQDAESGFLRKVVSEYRVAGRTIQDSDVAAMTIHLFLSMLPLHSDRPDRQEAFVANALRLYMQHWG